MWLLLFLIVLELGWWGAERRKVTRLAQREQLELELLAAGGFSCDRFRIDGQDWVWARAKTDAALEVLQRLPELQVLDLTDSRVTDAGISRLAVLPRLERLRLDGTEVSDAGLKSLKALHRLRYLSLFATQVTKTGVDELKKALPNLEIRW